MGDQPFGLPVLGDRPAPPPAPEVPADAPLEEKVVAALKGVYDPEIPINIYELGLIYELKVGAGGSVAVKMTLTTPACPVAGSLPGMVRERILAIPSVTSAQVDLVWDPPWTKERMSEEAQLQLGLF